MPSWSLLKKLNQKGSNWNVKRWVKGQNRKHRSSLKWTKRTSTKDIDALDIEIPILTRRIYREYTSLADLDVTQFSFTPVAYQAFDETSEREIVFKDMATGEVTHTTVLDGSGVADYRNTLGYFAQTIQKELRLVSGYDVLYGKIKDFVQHQLFGGTVMLEDPEYPTKSVRTPCHKNRHGNVQIRHQRPHNTG